MGVMAGGGEDKQEDIIQYTTCMDIILERVNKEPEEPLMCNWNTVIL